MSEGKGKETAPPAPQGHLSNRGRGNAAFRWCFARSVPMGRADLPTGRPESTRPMQGSTAARRPFAMEEALTVLPSGEPLPTLTTRTSLFSWVERPHRTFPRRLPCFPGSSARIAHSPGAPASRWAWFIIPLSGRAGSHPGLRCAASLIVQGL